MGMSQKKCSVVLSQRQQCISPQPKSILPHSSRLAMMRPIC